LLVGAVVHVTDVPAAATLIGLTFPVQPSPLLLRNNSVRYPHQKAQGLPQAKSIEEAYSKREPVQNPKLRYFKPFEFFEHTGSPTAQSPTDTRSSHSSVWPSSQWNSVGALKPPNGRNGTGTERLRRANSTNETI